MHSSQNQFDRKTVALAAENTIATVEQERATAFIEYSNRSWLYRMACTLFGPGKPTWMHYGKQQVAEKILLSAQCCSGKTITLDLDEFQQIAAAWPKNSMGGKA